MPLSPSGTRLVALLAMIALPALAQGRAARLLDTSDAPLLALAPTGSALHLLPGAVEVTATHQGPGYGEHFVKTYAASLIGSTAGTVLAGALGPAAITLIGTAIPFLLAQVLVGPIITVLAAMLVGNEGHFSGRYGFWLAWGAATVLHLATYLVASLALATPVGWTNPVAMLVYTLVDGLLMTGGAVGTMHLAAPKPVAAVLPSFVPGVSETQVIALGKVDL
jgi:hypothetical protein